MLTRRHILQMLALAGAVAPAGAFPAFAQEEKDIPAPQPAFGEPEPFGPDTVIAMARDLASREYVPVPLVPEAWREMNYDQYKNLLFDPRSAVWHGTGLPYEFDLFAPGLYFTQGVDVHVVEGDAAREVLFEPRLFLMTDQVPDAVRNDTSETLGFSGFRLRTEINRPDRREEFAVFQGASYFRAIGRDQIYGLSARGLALRTGEAAGEEFPLFRAFWLERPDRGDRTVTIHALLDSPSVAGAYTVRIEPGTATIMDVDAHVFPRVDLDHVGIAPGTSMFLFDETNHDRFDDFRPAVHDSDGLLVHNGAGEMLWRKLGNPKTLQVSSFVDENPRGFGLMQRARDPNDFADIEAFYERRPSLWVEPLDDWGQGAVTLVEIPADKEIFDNIVSYWRPREPLTPRDAGHRFRYRLTWGGDPMIAGARARVLDTHIGGQPFDGREGGRHVAIDFGKHHLLPARMEDLTIHLSADVLDGDGLKGPVVKRNPNTGGVRVDFAFYPEDRSSVELRSQLIANGRPVSEVWLYRWTNTDT